MKRNLWMVILLCLFLTGCSNKEQVNNDLVICPAQPSQGTVMLSFEKSLTIDSLIIDSEKPPIFENIKKDKNCNIFISSNRPAPRIFKFDQNGTFVKQFLGKGEGPGELKFIARTNYVDEQVFASSNRKVVQYNLKGDYVSENKFKQYYQGIVFINQDTFIANFYRVEDKHQGVISRCCSILQKNGEKEIVKLFDSNKKNIGRTLVQEGDLKFSFTLADITPDYISCYCDESQSIYQCLTSEPTLYIRGKNGVLKKTIKRNFEKKILTKENKAEYMKSFRRISGEIQGLIKRNFPKHMTAISTIEVLPKGYFAVFFNKDLGLHEICLFDKDGNFKYIIQFPREHSVYYHVFTREGVAMIERSEDRDIYVEYKIKNLPEIFTN